MDILYSYLVSGLWIAWFIYWRISAAGVKAVRRRESALSRAAHLLPLALAGLLLWIPTMAGGGILFQRFIPQTLVSYWTGTLLLALGLAFSVWARVYLG